MRSSMIALLTAFIVPFSGLLGVAHAAEINTPLIQAGSGAVTYGCFVTNLSNRTIEIDIDLFSFSGSLVHSLPKSLSPGATGGNLLVGSSTPSLRCRVTGKFPKRKVTVSLQLRDTNSTTQLSVPGT